MTAHEIAELQELAELQVDDEIVQLPNDPTSVEDEDLSSPEWQVLLSSPMKGMKIEDKLKVCSKCDGSGYEVTTNSPSSSPSFSSRKSELGVGVVQGSPLTCGGTADKSTEDSSQIGPRSSDVDVEIPVML